MQNDACDNDVMHTQNLFMDLSVMGVPVTSHPSPSCAGSSCLSPCDRQGVSVSLTHILIDEVCSDCLEKCVPRRHAKQSQTHTHTTLRKLSHHEPMMMSLYVYVCLFM